ncbi:MAG: hypothetical protein GYA50_03775 [Eubacteriaceae bacterium]|nr:hypothetical protein [Eubacteriaceae bacterium]
MATLYEDLKRNILRDYGNTNAVLSSFRQLNGFKSKSLVYNFCTKKAETTEEIITFIDELNGINGLQADIMPFLAFAQNIYEEIALPDDNTIKKAFLLFPYSYKLLASMACKANMNTEEYKEKYVID